MNKLLPPLVVLSCLVSSCETATPENYFDRAVLNCNLMHGFAGAGMERQLKDPSVKLAPGGGTVQMTRKEMVDGLIQSIEEAHSKVRKLKKTDETRDMLKASYALYEYVLPVYRRRYQELARLYDEGATGSEILAFQLEIRTEYAAGFQSRMDALTAAAKPFAEKHGIKVQWDVRTSPGG
jgi:hypothetical protein